MCHVAQMCHISTESVSDNVWHVANHSADYDFPAFEQ